MAAPRLTGGRARNRPLPGGVPASARPTSARVREALFSMVGQALDDQRVLDAFGGSGLLGLEAWSRGARVVIVEAHGAAARRIRDSVRGLGADCEVRRGDVLRLGPTLGRFDGILADPPYALDPGPVVQALGPLTDGWLVLETEEGTAVPDGAEVGLEVERRRSYGGTALTVYRRPG